MNWRSRRGSLTIYFCLMLTALILIYSILLQAAQIKAAENDLNRALTAQIQTSLARYDQKWQQFGLFGFQEDEVDQSVFSASLPLSLHSCPLQIEPKEPLSEPDVLRRQIIRYMKVRLPAAYFDLLMNKLTNIHHAIAGQNTESPASIQPAVEFRYIKTSSSLQSILDPILKTVSGSSTAIQEAADQLFGGLLNQLQDQALLQLQDIYQQYAQDLFGVESDNVFIRSLGQLPDFCNPESISRMAGYLDQVLTFSTAPVYEKCCLNEYILGHFRPAVQCMRLPDGVNQLETIGGQTFASLPASRDSEVEKILTGISASGSARLVIQAVITCLRSFIHLAVILTDQTRMASIRTAAGGFSAAIAAFTAGTVVIEPEIMTYLVVMGQAIGEGLADCRKLLTGHGLEFWPGRSSVQIIFYYQDYLRLFLLTVTQVTLIERIAIQLQQILPGPCYSALEVATEYRQKAYCLKGGYQT